MSKNKKKENPKKSGKIVESNVQSIPKKRNYWLPLLLILVATYVAYSPTFENDFVDWDDDIYVEKNTLITEGEVGKMFQLNFGDAIKAAYDKEAREKLDKTSFVAGNYHPLSVYSLYLNFKDTQLDPYSYQLTNIIFHLLNVLLVFLFLKRVLPDKRFAILIGTALFALHPMHVESVTWISERKDVLYSFFFLLGILGYLKYRERKQFIFLGIALILFFLSCLSKPSAIIFPLIIVLIDIWMDKKLFWRNLILYTPFFAISLLFGLITLSAQIDSGATGQIDRFFSLGEKFILAFHCVQLYFLKFFVPYDLCAYYPLPLSLNINMYFTALLTLAALFFSMKYKKVFPLVTLGFLFFILNLLLVLQIVGVGAALIAERYTYIPYIGLSIMVGVLIDAGLKKWKNNMVFYYLPICFTLLLALLTFNRVKVWKNTETLFSDVIVKRPALSLGYGKRANYYKDLSNISNDVTSRNQYLAKALKDFDKFLELDPKSVEDRNNRANIYFNYGNFEKAAADYLICYDLGDSSAKLMTNLACAKYQLSQREQAYFFFEKAIASDSIYFDAYKNRAVAWLNDKNYIRALQDFETYLRSDPLNSGIINSVGLCYRGLKQENNAIRSFDRAIANATTASDKSVFHFNRGVSFYSLGRKSEAKSDFIIAQQNGYGLPDALKIEFNL